MKAIGKYIVINPTKEDNKKTSGGLILTDKQREDIRYRQADIISLVTTSAAPSHDIGRPSTFMLSIIKSPNCSGEIYTNV